MRRVHRLTICLAVWATCTATLASAQAWDLDTIYPFGNQPDLAIDSLGNPHIIFNNCAVWEHCESDGPRELTYGTNDGSGWGFETIAGDPEGFLTSIFVDPGGTPHIAYCDSNWHRHYGYREADAWVMEDLDLENPPYYRASPSLVIDEFGEPHMAYIEREVVHYSHRVDGSWVEQSVPGAFLDNDFARAALVIDSQGVLHIGTRHYYSTAEFYTLEPEGWTSELLGTASAYYPWMVLDADDAAHFVYHGGGAHYATNAGGSWVEELVYSGYINEDNDIAVDASGRPFIVFTAASVSSGPPYVYELDLMLTWRENAGWVSELIDSSVSPSMWAISMSPRLEIDNFGMIHVLYRTQSSGELRYGTRPIPSGATSVPEARSTLAITGIAPNPFNPSTEISFRIHDEERVTIEVFDLSGRRVRRLLSETMSEGEHSVRWDGKTDSGLGAASGAYFFRLQTSEGEDTQRAVLIK